MTTYGSRLPRPGAPSSRVAAGVMLLVILELTVAHRPDPSQPGWSALHAQRPWLPGAGCVAYVAAVLIPVPLARRYGWLPRVGLAAYAAVTIVAYLVIGPHFTLGWITKGIELAIIGLVTVDLLVNRN